MKNRRHEQGVALLFALGVLSLMLISGLAFLGNSLISQKIAENSSESNLAKELARSAASRAMSQLAVFSLMQNQYMTYDAGRIYSSRAYNNSQNTGAATVANDGLAAKLLIPGLSENSAFDGYGQYSRAKWLYVYDNGEISDNGTAAPSGSPKIIGRYAYQVLPQTSRSRLSLYAVTQGARGIAGGPVDPTAADRKIPHIHRWGVDVDELLIPDLPDRTNSAAEGLFTRFWGVTAPGSGNEPPQYELDNFFNLFSSTTSPNHLSIRDSLTQNYKNWLRNIFTEGKGRVAREAYSDNGALSAASGNWYPRFNLGRCNGGDNWYNRFIKGAETEDTVKNNAVILERLSRHPHLECTIGGSTSSPFTFVDNCLEDSQYDPFGLPFLRRMGSNTEKGAFSSVENLRKQIAANLNDYCDADSVPTSDVAAAGWKELAGAVSGLPNYTGNEKTPYINEVGFGFKLHGASLSVDGTKYLFKTDIHAAVLAELIKIYPDLTISSATLHGFLKGLSVTLEVSVNGKVAKGTFNNGTENYDEFSFIDAKKEGTFTFDVASGKNFSIDFGSGSNRGSGGTDGPYWLNLNRIFGAPASGTNVAESIDLAKEIFKQDTNRTWVSGDSWQTTPSTISVTPEKISVKVKSVSFNLGNLVLEMPSGTGVDFVKVAPGTRTVTPISETELISAANTSDLGTQTGDGKGYFYGGSMQAIDPRQNLHAALANAGNAANEWHTVFEPTIGTEGTVPTWDEISTSGTVRGRVNVCSKPNAPLYSDGTTAIQEKDRDTESVDVPEYVAAAGAAAEKMISTAVIRNAPMRSPWELGFIHRGIPFQTINLKRAGGIDDTGILADTAHSGGNYSNWNEPLGTKYEYGDAGILDQIKMTEYNKSYGKVDLQALTATTPWWEVSGTTPSVATMNLAVFKSLFNQIRRQTAVQFLAESVEDNKAAVAGGVPVLTGTAYGIASVTLPSAPTSKLRSKILNNNASIWSLSSDATDAAKEELIGKSFNLIEGQSFSPPNVFRILVVAQSIRDLAGSIPRWNLSVSPSTLTTHTASQGVFDYSSGIYYDDIMGECKMLMTVEKEEYMDGTTPRARLRVKQIEYLD